MFRIVVDTQIFWRGLTANSSSLNAKFFDQWLKGNFILVVSKDIVNEIITLASYFLQHKAEWITVNTNLPKSVCRDPKDIKFLACALEGAVDYIVSADNDLLAIKEFRSIKIVTVPQIMNFLTL